MKKPLYKRVKTQVLSRSAQFFIDSLFRIKGYGLENIPETGNFILAANHVSLLDPPVICSTLYKKRFFSPVATKGLWTFPLNILLDSLDAIPIDRKSNSSGKALEQMLSALKSRPLLIFPEGGIVAPGEVRAPKTGVGILATKTQLPVIPVAIYGSDICLPDGKFMPKPGKMTVLVGKPIYYKEDLEPRWVAEDVMSHIEILKQSLPLLASAGR